MHSTQMNVLLYVNGPAVEKGFVGSLLAVGAPVVYSLVPYSLATHSIVSESITTDGALAPRHWLAETRCGARIR